MFTGLIENTGRVARVEERPGGAMRIAIASDLPPAELVDGESIAVDGVCLTVAARDDERFWADVIEETLSRTTFRDVAVGRRVNLERSLRLGDRLGGHLVQGHIDATAAVREVRRQGDDHRVRLAAEPEIRRYLAVKGSVALDGVSLTISGAGTGWFEVALIPETLARTTLGAREPGDRVNVEVDLVARYLEVLLGDRSPDRGVV